MPDWLRGYAPGPGPDLDWTEADLPAAPAAPTGLARGCARRPATLLCCPEPMCHSLDIRPERRDAQRALSYWVCQHCGSTWTDSLQAGSRAWLA
jgi:hypothetical protein